MSERPGVAAGDGVNGVNMALFGRNGFRLICTPEVDPNCSLPALGVSSTPRGAR